ncbi:hypothetical protein D3C80_1643180 [compost metagenome]
MELEHIFQYVGLVLVQHPQQTAQLADFRFQLLDREQHGVLLVHRAAHPGRSRQRRRCHPGHAMIDHEKENGRRGCRVLISCRIYGVR